MTGYRQQKPKIGLTKCPDLVDHYSQLLYERTNQCLFLDPNFFQVQTRE
jgi:hypothetical protein